MTRKINFSSPIRSHMGYAQMARLIWPALRSFDVKCSDIEMQSTGADLGATAAEMLSAIGSHEDADFTVANMVPILWPKMWTTGRRIGYTTFEATPHPRSWRDLFASTEIIWTTSEYNRGTILTDVPSANCHVISPVASEVPIPPPSVGQKFNFFASFQWSARKNPSDLIRAFAFAFDGRTDVQLVLKCHHTSGSAFLGKAVSQILADLPLKTQPTIKIIPEILSEAQLKRVRQAANAYVSLSHGEGWGLPAWESALDGRPVIHTAGTAADEFLPKKSLIESYGSPVYGMERAVSPFFEAGSIWRQPRLDIAIDMLRDVVENYATWQELAATNAKSIREKYTVERCVSQMESSFV